MIPWDFCCRLQTLLEPPLRGVEAEGALHHLHLSNIDDSASGGVAPVRCVKGVVFPFTRRGSPSTSGESHPPQVERVTLHKWRGSPSTSGSIANPHHLRIT